MKYFKLELKHGKVINNKEDSKDFFYPFNSLHVYNMLCCLLDKQPIPQNRIVDTAKHYDYIKSAIDKSYVKYEKIGNNCLTVNKSHYNSNSKNESIKQYTWNDLYNAYVIKNNDTERYNNLLDYIGRLGIDYTIGFEKTMESLILLDNNLIDDFKKFLSNNKMTSLINYIENMTDYKGNIFNKKIPFKGSELCKKNYKGIIDTETYNAVFYILFDEYMIEEYNLYSKKWTNMLDGGLVTVVDIIDEEFLTEYDILDFIPISKLSSIRKSDIFSKFNYKNEHLNILNDKYDIKDILKCLDNMNIKYTEKDIKDLENILEKNENEKDTNKKRDNTVKQIKKISDKNFFHDKFLSELYNKLNINYTEEDLIIKNNKNEIQNLNISNIINKIENLINL